MPELGWREDPRPPRLRVSLAQQLLSSNPGAQELLNQTGTHLLTEEKTVSIVCGVGGWREGGLGPLNLLPRGTQALPHPKTEGYQPLSRDPRRGSHCAQTDSWPRQLSVWRRGGVQCLGRRPGGSCVHHPQEWGRASPCLNPSLQGLAPPASVVGGLGVGRGSGFRSPPQSLREAPCPPLPTGVNSRFKTLSRNSTSETNNTLYIN